MHYLVPATSIFKRNDRIAQVNATARNCCIALVYHEYSTSIPRIVLIWYIKLFKPAGEYCFVFRKNITHFYGELYSFLDALLLLLVRVLQPVRVEPDVVSLRRACLSFIPGRPAPPTTTSLSGRDDSKEKNLHAQQKFFRLSYSQNSEKY